VLECRQSELSPIFYASSLNRNQFRSKMQFLFLLLPLFLIFSTRFPACGWKTFHGARLARTDQFDRRKDGTSCQDLQALRGPQVEDRRVGSRKDEPLLSPSYCPNCLRSKSSLPSFHYLSPARSWLMAKTERRYVFSFPCSC
jgi:hypothetical protein